MGSLIVSMTRSPEDLLTVYVLAREAGLTRWGAEGLECPVPVVPLFETMADLERAPEIVREFLVHPVTKRSLSGLGEFQMMVGYSDSNKDCGILASQWGWQRWRRRRSGRRRWRRVDCGRCFSMDAGARWGAGLGRHTGSWRRCRMVRWAGCCG